MGPKNPMMMTTSTRKDVFFRPGRKRRVQQHCLNRLFIIMRIARIIYTDDVDDAKALLFTQSRTRPPVFWLISILLLLFFFLLKVSHFQNRRRPCVVGSTTPTLLFFTPIAGFFLMRPPAPLNKARAYQPKAKEMEWRKVKDKRQLGALRKWKEIQTSPFFFFFQYVYTNY